MPVAKPKKVSKRKKAEPEGLPEEVQALAPIFRAELQAYQGKYQEAARAFAKAGEPQKAIDLFADLRQWDEAKAFAQASKNVDATELTRKQAEWAEETSDWSRPPPTCKCRPATLYRPSGCSTSTSPRAGSRNFLSLYGR